MSRPALSYREELVLAEMRAIMGTYAARSDGWMRAYHISHFRGHALPDEIRGLTREMIGETLRSLARKGYVERRLDPAVAEYRLVTDLDEQDGTRAGMTAYPRGEHEWKPGDEPTPMLLRAADRLYEECRQAIMAHRLDARFGDAVLDYRQERDEAAELSDQATGERRR